MIPARVEGLGEEFGAQPLTTPKKTARAVKDCSFFHGDGAQDVTYDGFYKPIWKTLSKQGYATLSWSK